MSTISNLHKLITCMQVTIQSVFFFDYSLNSSLFSDDENMCSDADVRYEYSTVFKSIYISSYIE